MHSLVATTFSNPLNVLIKVFLMEYFDLGNVCLDEVVKDFDFPK